MKDWCKYSALKLGLWAHTFLDDLVLDQISDADIFVHQQRNDNFQPTKNPRGKSLYKSRTLSDKSINLIINLSKSL